MEKYRHKKTGKVVKKVGNLFYEENENFYIQDWIVKDSVDWELIEQPFKDGDVVKLKTYSNIMVKITNYEKSEGYGINYDNKWVKQNNWRFYSNPEDWKLATDKEWFEVLKNEAIKRGLVEGDRVYKDSNYKECVITNKNHNLFDKTLKYFTTNDKKDFWAYATPVNICIMQNGIWAEVIKNKTWDELEMHYMSDDNKIGEYKDYVTEYKEAYIKAIQNLKK